MFPTDLAVILGLLVLVNVVFRVPGLRDATIAGARIQTLVAIPTLLFVPGYTLVAVLFPRDTDRGAGHREEDGLVGLQSVGSVDLVERTALSFGMSVALVPLFALAIGVGWGFSRRAVLTGLTALILIGVALAAIRRLRLPPADRYGLPVDQWAGDLRRGLLRPDSAVDGVTNLVLLLAVLAAVGAVGYAAATPYQSGPSSSLYLVTENETGVHVASGYPTDFTAGDGQSLIVGIQNDEERRQPYTIVVTVERVRTDATQTTVIESQELGRVHPTVPPGATWTNRHTVAPTLVGEDLRLHYYLYRGTNAPSNPDSSSAYRDVYIWIDVAEA